MTKVNLDASKMIKTWDGVATESKAGPAPDVKGTKCSHNQSQNKSAEIVKGKK